MSAPTDLAPAIEQAAQSPLSVTSDGLTVTAQPIGAQVQADRYAAAKSARATKTRGLMFSKLIPSGPVSDQQGTGFGGVNQFDSPGPVV
jgi:hypothetical protein